MYGSAAIVGTTVNSYSGMQGGKNIYLIETNEYGISRNTQTFGGISDDFGKSVKALSNGKVIVLGHSSNNSNGGADFYLAQLSQSNLKQEWSIEWDDNYGDSNDDKASTLEIDKNGNFILLGKTKSYGDVGASDIWLLKVNANGDENYQRSFGYIGQFDEGKGAVSTLDGGVIIIGSTQYADNSMLTLIKVDKNGNL